MQIGKVDTGRLGDGQGSGEAGLIVIAGLHIVIAARDVVLVGEQRHVISDGRRNHGVRRKRAVLIADTFHFPIVDKVEDARVIGRAVDVGGRFHRLARIVAASPGTRQCVHPRR